MKKEKRNSLIGRLIGVTIVLVMNWCRTLLYWKNNHLLLTQGRYLSCTPYIFELVIGILWIALFIYKCRINKGDMEKKSLNL